MEKGNEQKRKPTLALHRVAAPVFLATLFLCFATVLIGMAQAKGETTKRLDLNTATAEELDKLPEVGPKLAKAIVRFREKGGPFRRVEDLLAVPGISKRRLEKIRPFVSVENARKSKSESQKSAFSSVLVSRSSHLEPFTSR